MPSCLILTFQGVLQAWGKHSFETYRPTELFPTRSGVTGFLAAALGITRDDNDKYLKLDSSYVYAARSDKKSKRYGSKMTDFHTVQNVRTVGKKTKNTEITRREYLEDSCFTLALMQRNKAVYSLEELAEAVQKPHFSLCLGRKSCPLGLPPFRCICEAGSIFEALYSQKPSSGLVYSEESIEKYEFVYPIRDVPIGSRCFDVRKVYCYEMGDDDVPKSAVV